MCICYLVELLHALPRVQLVAGTSSGPPIFDVMSTLGSATTLERIQTCIDNKWE
eukprot:m.323547 g.323547  ORF g.323547 m.323547 type:complete len:54 (+) comp20359_c1_seq3:1851-2012(+)